MTEEPASVRLLTLFRLTARDPVTCPITTLTDAKRALTAMPMMLVAALIADRLRSVRPLFLLSYRMLPFRSAYRQLSDEPATGFCINSESTVNEAKAGRDSFCPGQSKISKPFHLLRGNRAKKIVGRRFVISIQFHCPEGSNTGRCFHSCHLSF